MNDKLPPATAVAPIYCVKSSFELFEQFSHVVLGWDLDFRQLKRNNSPFWLEQLSSPRMLYSRAYLDCAFYQLGGPTAGFRTFALQANTCTRFNWCGHSISRQSLMAFPACGDFESNTQAGFDIFTLSLSVSLLEEMAELHYKRPLSDFLGPGEEVFDHSGGAVLELRAMLHAFSTHVGRWSLEGAKPPSTADVSALEYKLAELVLECLAVSQVKSTARKLSKRMIALSRVLATIEETPIEALSLSEVLRSVEVSRRTVEHAFQDRFDVSPAVYVKALRLRGLNRALLVGEKHKSSVKDICSLHGFSHLGQLAHDYHKLFGELPSMTLRRTVG